MRRVRSQRERDLDAIELAKRKGIMISQLGQLAADDRLHPESRPVVEWFAQQVRDAAAGTRLDELAALLPGAGIRRAHWWQGSPAAIETEPYDGEDDGEDQGDDAEDDADYPDDQGINAPSRAESPKFSPVTYSTPRALPVSNLPGPAWTRPGPAEAMTWAEALALLGWRIVPDAAGCQVSEGAAACGGTGSIRNIGAEGRACYQHYQGLASVIIRSYQ